MVEGVEVPKKPAAVRRVTASARERLNRLAEILYDFLPLTARSKNAVTFTSIFAESSVAHYLEGPSNKQQALEQGFAELYRRHQRLPRMIIRKVVPAAVAYRKHQRRPLQRSELDELAGCLGDLGIDMEKELSEVELDEALPRVTVPPKKLKAAFRQHDLEPEIAGDPLTLFEDGHFNEAVRKAAELYEDVVHERSEEDAYGRDLMARAFSTDELLDMARLEPENRDGFEDGYKFLAMGLTGAIRNVFSHGGEERRSPEECYEMLMFLNWMLRSLDN